MNAIAKTLLSIVAATGALLALPSVAAAANTPVLQYVWGGSAGTVVFIHGKGNCGRGAGGDCGDNPVKYWTNGANGQNMLNESTTRYTSTGTQYFEAFAIGHDTENQGYWSSADNVANCLRDLKNGTNNSTCNPNLYRRTSFRIVTHSAGAAITDRIISSGWYTDLTPSIVGSVISDQGALAGARSASALYNVDGQGNWVTGFVSWVAGKFGWELKSEGGWSLTRGNLNNEANLGRQGKSTIRFLKIGTSGGSCSANNNNWFCGVGVDEHDNDSKMGAACSSVGYSSDDDCDGILWQYDSDPSANPSAYGGGKYNHRFTGNYQRWFLSWANHSHGRNDAYTTKGDWQSASGCYTRSPGTCIGQYGL